MSLENALSAWGYAKGLRARWQRTLRKDKIVRQRIDHFVFHHFVFPHFCHDFPKI
jgi:hypothetical protein